MVKSTLILTVHHFQRIQQTKMIFNLNFSTYHCCKQPQHALQSKFPVFSCRELGQQHQRVIDCNQRCLCHNGRNLVVFSLARLNQVAVRSDTLHSLKIWKNFNICETFFYIWDIRKMYKSWKQVVHVFRWSFHWKLDLSSNLLSLWSTFLRFWFKCYDLK